MDQKLLPSVSVIIPTMCEQARWHSLLTAIASAQSQAGIDVKVIVAVNGDRFDPAHLAHLQTLPQVTVAYQPVGNVAVAQRLGRSLVGTSFFSFLDDDDEYLPDTLIHRLQPLLADVGLDFAVSNGWRRVDGVDRHCIDPSLAINADPIGTLTRVNWMASCAGIFRTARVGVDYFDGCTAYFEWTLIAFKLVSTLRMRYVEQPTFVINDSAQSASKKAAFHLAEIDVLRSILKLPLAPHIKLALRKKIAPTYHGLVHMSLNSGEPRQAWRYHFACLKAPKGSRYLLFTRKLPFLSLLISNSNKNRS